MSPPVSVNAAERIVSRLVLQAQARDLSTHVYVLSYDLADILLQTESKVLTAPLNADDEVEVSGICCSARH